MVTIPPKLRENIAKLFGFDDSEDAGSEVALNTAMVALADYAAASLIQDKTLLIVSSPVDEHAEDRKAARGDEESGYGCFFVSVDHPVGRAKAAEKASPGGSRHTPTARRTVD
ncbi:hypothetical protein G6F22_021512 [Rhizopus arrhizus]|nr:hypothetical protein G6F22_021512 [Rhizopus arrhizus]